MSFRMSHHDDKIGITCDGFDNLPEMLQGEIIKILGQSLRRDEYYVYFARCEIKVSTEAYTILRDYYKRAASAERRRSLDMLCSSGVYYPSDIQEIYEVQQGRCYFSGKPILKDPKNYSLDHLKPIHSRGSSWPSNLALVLKEINQEKHGRNKAQYWKILEKRHGADWVERKKEWCAEVDRKRRRIDRSRKKQVNENIQQLNQAIWEYFGCLEYDIELRMDSDQLIYDVDETMIIFPAGMLRKKQLWKTPDYAISIASAIRNKRMT